MLIPGIICGETNFTWKSIFISIAFFSYTPRISRFLLLSSKNELVFASKWRLCSDIFFYLHASFCKCSQVESLNHVSAYEAKPRPKNKLRNQQQQPKPSTSQVKSSIQLLKERLVQKFEDQIQCDITSPDFQRFCWVRKRISAENLDKKLLWNFRNNFFPPKNFQSLIKDLVKRKDFLAFDTHLRQIQINYHWEKLLTKIAFFKNSVLPNFPSLVKLSKWLEITKN